MASRPFAAPADPPARRKRACAREAAVRPVIIFTPCPSSTRTTSPGAARDRAAARRSGVRHRIRTRCWSGAPSRSAASCCSCSCSSSRFALVRELAQGERAEGLQPRGLLDHQGVRPRRSAQPFFQLLGQAASDSPAGPPDQHLRLPRAGGVAAQAGQGPRRAGRDEGRPAVAADGARSSAATGSPRSPRRSAPRSATRARRPTTAITQIAGQMQTFLASDVLYQTRVSPLIKQRARRRGDRRPEDRPVALPARDRVAEREDGGRRARPADHRRHPQDRRDRARHCTAPGSSR